MTKYEVELDEVVVVLSDVKDLKVEVVAEVIT